MIIPLQPSKTLYLRLIQLIDFPTWTTKLPFMCITVIFLTFDLRCVCREGQHFLYCIAQIKTFIQHISCPLPKHPLWASSCVSAGGRNRGNLPSTTPTNGGPPPPIPNTGSFTWKLAWVTLPICTSESHLCTVNMEGWLVPIQFCLIGEEL